MKLASVKSQPAYVRIRDELADRITGGVIAENAKLPTERDMCRQYEVSRITVRHALTLLEQEGLIRKRQGQGIFVCPKRYEQPLNQRYSFAQWLKQQNAVPSWKLLGMQLAGADARVAQKLALQKDEPCYGLRRISFADKAPYAYEELYLPAPLLQGATQEQIERDGLYPTVERLTGLVFDRASETYEAVLATPEIAALLSRKPPLALTRLERQSFAGDRPCEFSVRYILGDKYRFRLTFD